VQKIFSNKFDLFWTTLFFLITAYSVFNASKKVYPTKKLKRKGLCLLRENIPWAIGKKSVQWRKNKR
jgi:hypothetical protein